MSGSQIADLIINNMNNINWEANDQSMYRMLAMKATADGIHKYIIDNWKVEAITVGGVVVPPATIPFTEMLTVDLLIPPAAVLTNNLMTMTSMAANLMPLFAAIFKWLSTPPLEIIITRGVLLVPSGRGTVLFPSMTAMGATCLAEMSSSKPDNMHAAWSILGKHIYNGLMANFIAPIVTTGVCSAPSGVYNGITNCTLTF